MADLKLTADFTDLQTLKRELLDIPKKARDSARTFETEFARAERILAKQAQQFQKNAVESQKFYSQLLKLNNVTKSAEQSAKVFARELEKQDRAATKAGQAAAKLENEFRELALSGKSAEQSAQAMERAFRQQELATERSAESFRQLRASIDPAYRAQQQLLNTKRLLRAQVQQNNITMAEAVNMLRQYRAAQIASNIATQRSNKGLARSGLVIQQVGYQTGDFLVQVQSGTSAFVAFGQQATQLAGLLTMSLNPRIVALGVGLSILIPLTTAFAAYLQRTKEATDSASKSAKYFEDAIKSLDNSVQDFLTTREAMAKGVTKEEYLSLESLDEAQRSMDEAREKLEALRKAATGEARTTKIPSLGEFVGSLPNMAAAEAALTAATERYNIIKEMTDEKRAELSKELGRELKLQQEINTFGEDSAQVAALKLSFQEEDLEAQAKKLGFSKDEIPLLKDQLRQAALIVQEREKAAKIEAAFLKNTEAAGDEMVKAFNAVKDLTEEIGQGAVEALRLGGVDITSGVDAAAKAAARLADNLNVSLGYAINIMTLGEEVKGRMVRRGVSTGAIPPEALADLPNPAAEGYEDLMAGRRKRAAQREREAERERERAAKAGAKDPLVQLQEQIRLEQELLGKTEAQQKVIRALGPDWQKYGNVAIETLVNLFEELDSTNRKIAEQQQIADTIKDSMSEAFMSMVDGTKSAKDAFRDMARAVIKQLYDILVVQQLVGSFDAKSKTGSGIVGAIMGALTGSKASGGSMMANRPYLVGERGPELVIPGRSATVTNADLTRKSMGGSDGLVVNNNITVNGGNDPAAIRMEVAKLMPQITNATKTAVIDARRRGGQMRAAFQ